MHTFIVDLEQPWKVISTD